MQNDDKQLIKKLSAEEAYDEEMREQDHTEALEFERTERIAEQYRLESLEQTEADELLWQEYQIGEWCRKNGYQS